MKYSAFILAAGLGERLRPITDHIPKPLIPLLGKPVIQYVMERVSGLPLKKIGMNLHYKQDMISTWLARSVFCSALTVFPEDQPLGTGGALKNASLFLRESSFLVHNADILSNIDLERLMASHLSSGNLATLAVHDSPAFNVLQIDEQGLLRFVGQENVLPEKFRLLAFTGIAAYSPDFLKLLPEGPSSVVSTWQKAIREGAGIGTLDVSGCSWADIGTPGSYARAVLDELRQHGEMVYIHPSVTRCGDIRMDGHIVIEGKITNSFPGTGISLRNCIVLPGSNLEDSTHYENCILGPGFRIDLRRDEGFRITKGEYGLVGTGGSERRYFRIEREHGTAILMECQESDDDYQRHIEYTRFFLSHSVPVPQLIDTDNAHKKALFEDLGDLSLYNWMKCPRDPVEREHIYKKVLDALFLIHADASNNLQGCPSLQQRVFDYDHLRWETSYFTERFVLGIRHIKCENTPGLQDDFHRLALEVDAFPKRIIHRDFQSQNIMLAKDGSPRFLDYQGARVGPPAYDLASLLWDPYVHLDESLRERLVNYYVAKLEHSSLSFMASEFMATLLPCRLQRHMQALGAYGFLSSEKGKKYFLKYVPEGLRLLKEDTATTKKRYPELYRLVASL